MGTGEQDVAQDRAVRDAARAVFDQRLARIKAALAEKPVGRRIGDEAMSRARSSAEGALKVADENRWVVALTLTALMGWLLRRPLLRAGRSLLDFVRSGEPASPWQRLREWAGRKVKS